MLPTPRLLNHAGCVMMCPPPHYEDIAFIGTVTQTEDISQCRWQQRQNIRLTLSSVPGLGLCVGKISPSLEFLCNQTWPIPSGGGYFLPPTEGLWACSSGLTPRVDLQVLRDTQDFCVLVQVVPRLIYHLYEELLSHWNSGLPRAERTPRHHVPRLIRTGAKGSRCCHGILRL